MKIILWFSILVWVVSGLYTITSIDSPFGWAFETSLYLFALFTAVLVLWLARFLFYRQGLFARLLSIVPFILSLLLAFISTVCIIDYRILLPKITETSPKTWNQDYDFLKSKLYTHPAFKDSLTQSFLEEPRPDFEKLSDDESLVALMRMIGKFPDGHTFIHPLQPAIKSQFFPLVGYWFDDGYYIVRASDEYKFLEGKKLLQINNTPLEEILSKINSLTGPENQWQGQSQFDLFIFSANVLHGLGVIENAKSCTIQYQENGVVKGTKIDSQSFINWFYWALRPIDSDQVSPALMNLRKPNFQIRYDDTSRSVFLTFNLIQNDRKSSIATLEKTLESLLQKQPEKIIIDLRNCGGGDNTLYNGIIETLRKNKGTIYVFVTRKTFSAAVNFISELKMAFPIKLVGEPTGAGPNHYGDAEHYLSTGAGISAFISTKSWIFDSLYRTNTYHPDIKINYQYEDFKNSNDPWMNSIK